MLKLRIKHILTLILFLTVLIYSIDSFSIKNYLIQNNKTQNKKVSINFENDEKSLFLASLKSQFNITWGGSDYDYGYGVAVEQSSSSVYLAGTTNTFGVGNGDAFLVKYNSSGSKLWQKTWGGSEIDSGRGIAVDPLSNCVYLTGWTDSFGIGSSALLVKYDSLGAQIWNRTWREGSNAYGFAVAVDSSSGGIYFAGENNVGNVDALLVKYDSSGTQLWNRTWGGSSYEYGYGVAVDQPSGNVYLVGITRSFGAGVEDAFLAQYNSLGVQQWNRTWGGTYNDDGKGVAVDQTSGNVYIVGYTLSFGAAAFLIKYNSLGAQQWNHTWVGSTSSGSGSGVAIEQASGSIYLVGNFGSDKSDVFLVKYDLSGNKLWDNTWGGSDNDEGFGVIVDPSSDSVYIAGTTRSFGLSNGDAFLVKNICKANWYATWGGTDYDFGEGGVAIDLSSGCIYIAGSTYSFGAGNADAFLAKYDPSGAQIWKRMWGGSNADYGLGVAIDQSSGIVYLVGKIDSSGAGNDDIFLAKYNSSGGKLWEKIWGSNNDDEGWGVAVNQSSGNIYFTGRTDSFGAGNYDAFLAKSNSSGTQIWNCTWGGIDDDNGCGVAIDPSSDSIYLVGSTYSFGKGNADAFLAKYNSLGIQLWNRTWGGIYTDNGNGVAIEQSSGSIYISGETNSFSVGNTDAFLVKYDSSGTQLWNRTWGGVDIDDGNGVAVEQSSDSVYIMGSTYSFGSGNSDAFLAKYDSFGNKLWDNTWGGSNEDSGKGVAVEQSSDSVYIMGSTHSFGSGNSDAFLVKNLLKSNNQGTSPINLDSSDDSKKSDSQTKDIPVLLIVIFGIIIGGVGISISSFYVIHTRKKPLKQGEKLKKIIGVSNKVKLDMVMEALNVNRKDFSNKIVEWANQFHFTIDGDYLITNKDTELSKFMDELDKQFVEWEDKVHLKDGKKIK